MILETWTEKEYHENGQLMYETTFCSIDPNFEHLYKNIICAKNNKLLIRVGLTKRYHDNGQLNWTIKYNPDGSISKEKFPKCAKNGTIIEYL